MFKKNKNIFVVDTNVILNDYAAPFRMAKTHNVIIPYIVLQELDTKKTKNGSVGYNARRFTAAFKDELSTVKPKNKDANIFRASTNKNMHLFVELKNYEDEVHSAGFNNDMQILSIACHYAAKYKDKVMLLTNDNNLLAQAVVHGIKAESVNQHKADRDYTGVGDIILTDKLIQTWNEGKEVIIYDEDKYPNLHPMQVLLLKNKKSKRPVGYALFRGYGKPLDKVPHINEVFGVYPKNKEQSWLLALGKQMVSSNVDNDIDLLTIDGPAGCGKTMLALAIALHYTEDKGAFNTITLTKPVSAMGSQEVGFLKGGYKEKIMPFMQSYVDILEKLNYASMEMVMDEEMVQVKQSGKPTIKFDALTFIRGRNLSDIIIVDEAQNLTRHEIKSLVTRADEGAKVILIADTEQIDVASLDKFNNGFSYVVDKMKSVEFAAHIRLVKSERSRLAAAAGKVL